MIFLYILLALIILVVILISIAPKKYDIQRSVVINRPLPEVFGYLKYLNNQNYWSPWNKKDPDMKQEQSGTDGTIGFVNRWEGNKHVGVGEQEITGIIENERIDTQLRFYKPWKSVSNGYLLVREMEPHTTEVIWGFKGENKPPMNAMMLFFNMDKAVGKDFEEGLATLKTELEKGQPA